jgi:hypothetical protein
VNDASIVALGEWYVLGFTLDSTGGYGEFYINGREIGNFHGVAGAVTPTEFSIGASISGGTGPPDGSSFSDVRIWNRALNQVEMLTEMESLSPVYVEDLYAWWPLFDADSATRDYSGNGHTLTLSGGTLITGQQPQNVNVAYPFLDMPVDEGISPIMWQVA